MLLEIRFRSEILGREVAMNALVPDRGRGPFATLYLLHGMSDDFTAWLRYSRVDCHARDWPMIIVMPDGQRSMYANANEGPRFADHMIEEVVGETERVLPAKKTRGGRGIGGLSMGGYGALRLALANPDLFVSCHSHSGALLRGTCEWKDKKEIEFIRIFGRNPAGSEHDLIHLVDRCRKAGRGPKMLIDCGTEDFLLDENREFHAGLENWQIPHEYREFEGTHDWSYWDARLPAALAFHARAMKVKRVAGG